MQNGGIEITNLGKWDDTRIENDSLRDNVGQLHFVNGNERNTKTISIKRYYGTLGFSVEFQQEFGQVHRTVVPGEFNSSLTGTCASPSTSSFGCDPFNTFSKRFYFI